MEKIIATLIKAAPMVKLSLTLGFLPQNMMRTAAKREIPTARNGRMLIIVISETPPAIQI